MSPSPEDVQQAVLTLYGPTSDSAQREQANAFLMCIMDAPQAWGLAMALLVSPSSPPPPLEVPFFAAQLLHTKACRDWVQLQQEPGLASQLSQRLLEYLRQQQQAQPSAQPQQELQRLILFRCCYTVAVLAVKTPPASSSQNEGGGGIAQLLTHAFQFVGGSAEGVASTPATALMTGLCLLRSLPEEIDRQDMGKSRREELHHGALRGCVPQVLGVVEAFLLQRRELAQLALETLEAWVGLGGLTLSSLSQQAPGLFQELLNWLKAPAGGMRGGQEDVDLLIATCKLLTCLAGVSEGHPRPPARNAVVQHVYEAILTGVGPTLQSGHETLVHVFGACVIELATQEAEELASGQNLQMIEVLLALTNHEHTHLSTLALEFWEAFMDVPVAERDPRLAAPLSGRLVELLVGRLVYPSHFASWEEELNLEAEEFGRYREGDLAKGLLTSCSGVLRLQFFSHLRQHLDAAQQQQQSSSSSWQAAEVVLLMMQQVSGTALAHMTARMGTAEQREDRAATASLLVDLLHRCLSTPALAESSHPLLLRALLRFVAAYHPLLLPNAAAGIDEAKARLLHQLALRCILQGLSRRDVDSQPAAMALRAVCVGALSSGIVATDPDALALVLGALGQAEQGQADMADKLVVVEATIRTLLVSPDLDQARAMLQHFAGPLFERMNGALGAFGQPGVDAAVLLQTLADTLQLVGQMIRFLDAKGPQEAAHVAQDLVEWLWRVLEKVADVTSLGEVARPVLDQLFPLYRHLVGGLKSLVAPHLPGLLSLVVRLYNDNLHEGALETVGHIVEMFPEAQAAGNGNGNGGETSAAFADLFTAMSIRTFEYVRAGHLPQECPVLMAAFFDMALRWCSFWPQIFFASATLPTLLDLSLACLEVTKEREATRSALRLLRDLVKTLQSTPDAPYVPATLALLQAEDRGQRLCTLTLAAVVGGAPTILVANFFECFAALLQALPNVAGGWVQTAVCDPRVLRDEAFPSIDKPLLLEILHRLGLGAGQHKQRLRLLLDDVSKIRSGEMEPDTLRNYLV